MKFKFILLFTILLLLCSCTNNQQIEDEVEKLIYHTVNVDGEEQYVLDGELAVKPEKEKEGFTLIDWLCDGVSYDWTSPVKKDLVIESVWSEVPMVENNFHEMNLKVKNSESKVTAEYSYEGIHISIVVLDKDVYTLSSDMGMNDNVEINIQTVPTLKYDKNYTLNFLCNAKGEHWIRKATGPYEFSGNGAYATFGILGENYDYTFELTENGYSVEIFFSWQILNSSYKEGFGNVRMISSLRDSFTGGSEWNYYMDNSCVWGRPYTYLLLDKENNFVRQNNRPLDVESAFENSSIYEGESLLDNLAVLSGEGASLTARLETGCMLFTDRRHGLNPDALDDSLLGKSYLFDSINGSYGKVTSSGYVLMLVPNSNYSNIEDNLRDDGFIKIGIDTLGIASTVVNGSLDEGVSYYVKWCEVGEVINYKKYCIVIFDELDTVEYTKDWLTDVATFNTDFTGHELIDRNWHCIPTIAVTKGGRIYASYESGGNNEPQDANYLIVSCSDDGGSTWQDLWWIYNHNNSSSVNDSQIWVDPDGRLWITYQQRNAGSGFDKFVGCWAAVINNPDVEIDALLELEMKPRRLFDGFMKNDIVVLKDGTWLAAPNDFIDENNTIVYASTDKGETWTVRGNAYAPLATNFDETVIVELKDGTLWMTMRNDTGQIVQVYSYDQGYTWTDASQTGIDNPVSRFQVKRLTSGNLLMINNDTNSGRLNLTAYLSFDDGKTWPYKMLIDSETTSYPDVSFDSDGNIYVIYDQHRHAKGNIHMAIFTEEYLMNHTRIENSKIYHVACTYRESNSNVEGSYLGDSIWFEKSNGWNLENDNGSNPVAIQMGAGTQFISFKNGLLTDFYVETKVHAHSIVDRDGYPKFGIVLRSADDKQIYYYINGESWFSGTKAWHVGYVENYNWGNEVEVPASIDYVNDYVTLGILKEGNKFSFFVNGYLVLEGDNLAGMNESTSVEVQFVTLNTRVTYKDYFVTTEIDEVREKYENVETDVLYIGDSFISYKYWDSFSSEMSGVNLGVSGTEVSYWINLIDYVVKYNPKTIVMHIGVNDLDRGKTGVQTSNLVKELFDKLHEKLPNAKILYISANPSQNYWDRHTEIDVSNELVEAYCAEKDYLYYLDFAKNLYLDDKIYVKTSLEIDGLHLNHLGYELWNKEIKKALLEMKGADN